MSSAQSTETGSAQYLSFTLAEETFAVNISRVREVLEFTSVTFVPKMPDFMRGVINLRGSVVPVVDLRLQLGMSRTEKALNTCIIIAEASVNAETTVIGALADSVQEVFELDPAQIEHTPKIGTQLRTEYLSGMGKKDEKFVLLLDFDRIFDAQELESVRQAGLQENTEFSGSSESGVSIIM
jgi:purine-binding chemotaxis protein CheW